MIDLWPSRPVAEACITLAVRAPITQRRRGLPPSTAIVLASRADARYTSRIFFFFFQAEDGIRDYKVTGVQTCALPISESGGRRRSPAPAFDRGYGGLRVPHVLNRAHGGLRVPHVLGDDQRMGVGDDARLGVDRRADVLGDAEGVLVCHSVPVAKRGAGQPLGDELVDRLWVLRPWVHLLRGGDEPPRGAQARDERLGRRHHRKDLAQRAVDRG